MAFWQADEFSGDLSQALAHLNEAAHSSARRTIACKSYFDAFNNLWSAFSRHEKVDRGDQSAFPALLKTIAESDRDSLFASDCFNTLLSIEPEIFDHSILRKKRHAPGTPLSEELRKIASDKHTALRNSVINLQKPNSDTTSDTIIKKLADLLYVVRCNIMHGEKTPFGPDHEKAERDERVSGVVVPVLQRLFDLLLYQPSQKLIAYGTLCPGGSNAAILGEVIGTWDPCTIRGKITASDGLSGFQWDPVGPPLTAQLFTAESLAGFWDRLDEFEGSAYRRILVPAESGGGTVVANIYASS